MAEILYNRCFGGFGFSDEASREYCRRKGVASLDPYEIERHDTLMVQIVKEMGPSANGLCAKLAIHTIPMQYLKYYEIEEYDGSESVRIKYDAYRIETAKSLLRDANLTKSEKIARAIAVLSAQLEP